MSTIVEKYEEDMAWLRDEIPGVSEDHQESFAERVAVMTNGGMDERRARTLAK